MNRLIGFLFAFVLSVSLSTTASAQISLGGGIVYGFDIEELGIQASGTYNLSPEMRLGGDIIYWLIGDDSFMGESWSTTYMEVNANFNYIFYDENDLILYGIGTLGIHYASFSYDFNFNGFSDSGSESDTELGLGLGVGLEYNLGSVVLYSEPRIFLSGFDQFAISAGVRVPI
jgi:opacity protein-like surface antigen